MADFNLDKELQEILKQKPNLKELSSKLSITSTNPDGTGEIELKIIAVAESVFFKTLKLYAIGRSDRIEGWYHPLCEDIVERRPILFSRGEEFLREEFHLPDEIVAGFKEALGCYKHGYYNASVAMSRRLLERVLIIKGAKRKQRICEMLDDLIQRNIIKPEFKMFCDGVKCLGNKASHISECESSQDDAEQALDLIDFIVTWLFGDVEEIPIESQQK